MFKKPTDAELKNRFTHHPPVSSDQIDKYARIRAKALEFATLIRDETPCCPEQTRAINSVDEAMMLANSAIARDQGEQVDAVTAAACKGFETPRTDSKGH